MGIGFRQRHWLIRKAAEVAPEHRVRIFGSRLNPNRHRWVTGGDWGPMGKLQLRFLIDQGLARITTFLTWGAAGYVAVSTSFATLMPAFTVAWRRTRTS
jgi:hypothetical protein